MTPTQFKTIRINAGLNHKQLAHILRVSGRVTYRYEDGTRPVSGPVAVLMEMIDRGEKEILDK